MIWLLFLPLLTFAAYSPPPVYKPHIFNSLKDTVDAHRVDGARALYRINCRKMSEADAMHSLNDMRTIARQLRDLHLECAIFDMRADYYSVNRGYNLKSNIYFNKAIAFAQGEDMQLETGIYQHRKANYLFLYKYNSAACRYYLLSEENLREVGFDNVPEMGNIFSETAIFYYSVGDFDNARENLRRALKYQRQVNRTRINIVNTIGLTYRNSNQYSIAETYFNNALYMAKAIKDSAWVAIANGNIGSIYFLQHRYGKALPLIEDDYRQSLKYEQKLNSAIALLRLIRINIDYSELKLAGMRLDTADKILLKCTENVLTQRVQYYELKTTLSERLDHVADATRYRNTSEKLRDSVSKRDNVAAIERVKMQWVMEKSREEFNNLKKSAQLNAFKQNTIITVLLLLVIITALIYNRQRLKAKKDKELMESEKRRLDEELQNASLSLNGYTENLKQKNILIESFKTELEKVKGQFSDTDVAVNLDKMMQAHIMTEENWEEFKKLFSRVHTTFFYNLRHQYGNLSGTDVRLLALIKLKLNNKEMAAMLGITIDGVKKAKQRLRKKMELLESEELEDVVNSL
ncbi:helix-turn-helix transcriptional regulator [Mucilaginibacter phyllosphaerae]|uniref:DNA-binding CsgD family transcriptional regulator n=1 Tax=Mucilaginibacter phyllosphaerae TaxID=1812349 RepID=A0A4Y8AF59_9SPHI|nr:tetratricopeptide repeat protein [Mucilaginibacter phyllosphaerae]MBB3969021.1 DNA-binding CsgD family transcriptional regulator [Mucilaginibacter phyllosphaerae]TEW67363.1 tetratricopeptide repeat protein [Mucilaginibacter phyllosphaerae]